MKAALSPHMEAMLRRVGRDGVVDLILFHLDAGPWSTETERALARRGLVKRSADGWDVAITSGGRRWLNQNPERGAA